MPSELPTAKTLADDIPPPSRAAPAKASVADEA